MPTYVLINTITEEEREEFFRSYSDLQEFLKDNPTYTQGVGKCNIVSGHGANFKTDAEFKSLLKHVKKNNHGAKIDIN